MIASVSLNISLGCWASTSSWWSAKFIEKSLSCRRKLCCCFIVKLSDAKVFDGEKGEKIPILWPFRAEETTVSYMGIVLLCWFSHVKQKICIYCDKKKGSSVVHVYMLELTSQNDKTQFSCFPTAAKHRKSSPRFGRMMYTFTAGCLLFSPRLFFFCLHTHWWRKASPRHVCTDERGKTTAAFFFFIYFIGEGERIFVNLSSFTHALWQVSDNNSDSK